MSDNPSTSENDISNLPSLFQEGLNLFNNLEKDHEATNSLEVQVRISYDTDTYIFEHFFYLIPIYNYCVTVYFR